MRGGGVSQHPADQLIRELVRTGRAATPNEVEQLVERMATAPFDTRVVRVRVAARGVSYRGQTLGARADSLTFHLIKRVALDRQWVDGTTADDYVHDLRRAVRDPGARITVYERHGGAVAAVVTPTEQILPPERRGPVAQPHLAVFYSADRGIIVSGYQFSALDQTSIPQEARWLR
jgi:hypothetical protein